MLAATPDEKAAFDTVEAARTLLGLPPVRQLDEPAMSKFSPSDAAFSGFRLVRENLKTVALWALIMTVVSIAYSVVMIHFFGDELNGLSTYMQSAGSEPDPNELAAAFAKVVPVTLLSVPYLVLVNAVMFAGVNRLILRPHEGGLLRLRLGGDELRQAAIWVLFNVTLFGAFLIGSVLTEFFAVMKDAIGALLALLAFVGTLGGVVYLAIRLSLSSAATFDAGKVVFFRSMPLTKGQFWPLMGAYFLAVVMCVIVFLLLFTIISAVATIISGDIGAAGRLMQADSSSLKAFFTPMGIAQTMFSGLMSVLTTLIIFAPAPTIYKALREGQAAAEGNGGW